MEGIVSVWHSVTIFVRLLVTLLQKSSALWIAEVLHNEVLKVAFLLFLLVFVVFVFVILVFVIFVFVILILIVFVLIFIVILFVVIFLVVILLISVLIIFLIVVLFVIVFLVCILIVLLVIIFLVIILLGFRLGITRELCIFLGRAYLHFVLVLAVALVELLETTSLFFLLGLVGWLLFVVLDQFE